MKAFALVVALGFAALTVSATVATGGVSATAHVRVVMGKPGVFSFTLSPTHVRHGTVVFELQNKGTISHDFSIAGHKSKMIASGASGTLTVRFARAGKYPYVCTVPGHAMAGMKGILTVS